MMQNFIGQTIAGRYRVDAFLGRGGMAEVYKVWDTQRSVILALKLLHEDLALDKVFLQRFKREARALSHLQHPNIVRFYGLEIHDRLVFMLLDYIPGESLKHKIYDSAGPLPLTEIRNIMRSLCSALAYAHRENLVHCDLKPGNVLFAADGTAFLADFGIARLTDAATATLVGAGTPAYMAPEQVRGMNPVPQTDIYALGVILFEMLTGGQQPFTGDSDTTSGTTSAKVRWEQVNLPPPSPRLYNLKISPGLEKVILRCLEKSTKDRYLTSMELDNDLERALPDGKSSQRIASKLNKDLRKIDQCLENRYKFAPYGVNDTVVLTPVEWQILAQIKLNRSISQIIKALDLSEDAIVNLINNMITKGLLIEEKANKTSDIKLVKKDYMAELIKLYTSIIGPIAPIIIEDEIAKLGERIDSLPIDKASELVDRLGREIEDERKRSIFQYQELNIHRG